MKYLSPVMMTALALCLTLHPSYAMHDDEQPSHQARTGSSGSGEEDDSTTQADERTIIPANLQDSLRLALTTLDSKRRCQELEIETPILRKLVEIQQKLLQQHKDLEIQKNASGDIASHSAPENPFPGLEDVTDTFFLITSHLGSPLYFQDLVIPFDPKYPDGLALTIKELEIPHNLHNETWKLRRVSRGFKNFIDYYTPESDLNARTMVPPYVRDFLRKKGSYARLGMGQHICSEPDEILDTYYLFDLQGNTLKQTMIYQSSLRQSYLFATLFYQVLPDQPTVYAKNLLLNPSKTTITAGEEWKSCISHYYLGDDAQLILSNNQTIKEVKNPLLQKCAMPSVDLTGFKNLTRLNLRGNFSITANDLLPLSALTSLNIRGAYREYDNEENFQIKGLRNLRSLTELHLDAEHPDIAEVLHLPHLAKLYCYDSDYCNVFDAMTLLTSGLVSYMENKEGLQDHPYLSAYINYFEKRMFIPNAYSWGPFNYEGMPNLVEEAVDINKDQPLTMTLYHQGTDQSKTVSLSDEDRQFLMTYQTKGTREDRSASRFNNKQRRDVMEIFLDFMEISGKSFTFLGTSMIDTYLNLELDSPEFSNPLENEFIAFKTYLNGPKD